MPDVQARVMQAVYGGDIWEGFWPDRPPGPVQGWHGQHTLLARLAVEARPSVLIDVGVWKGQSTIWMARQIETAQLDGCVIAVDTFLGSAEHWDGRINQRTDLFRRHTGMPDLHAQFVANVWHAGVSGYVVPMPQTSTTASDILFRRRIGAGLVHIDASHEYSDVVRDIDGYWRLIAPGGYLVGDDYSWSGVKQAADEFAARTGLALVEDRGKWLLQKPG